MSLTYTTYVSTMAQLLVIADVNDVNFQAILPSIIDYAELRIQRELDLTVDSTRNSTVSCAVGTRTQAVPSTMIIVEGLNLITPAGTTNPELGSRNIVIPTSLALLDSVYNALPSQTGLPKYFTMLDPTTMILGPAPDAAYRMEIIGCQRLTPISGSNSSNWISTYMPDLLIAASMVFGLGWQRDFGGQSDDPKAAISWEAQYQTLKAGADSEEARKQCKADAWTAQVPSTIAQTGRG